MDLQVSTTSGDLVITDGNLILLEETDAIEQHLRIALQMFKGEWFLAPDDGVPYIQKFFTKNPSMGAITAILRKAILKVPGVTQINTFDVQFNSVARRLSVTFNVSTPIGQTITFTDFVVA